MIGFEKMVLFALFALMFFAYPSFAGREEYYFNANVTTDASATVCSATSAAGSTCVDNINRSSTLDAANENIVVGFGEPGTSHINFTTDSSVFSYDADIAGTAYLSIYCNTSTSFKSHIGRVKLLNLSTNHKLATVPETQILEFHPPQSGTDNDITGDCQNTGAAFRKNYQLGTIPAGTILKAGEALRVKLNFTSVSAPGNRYTKFYWGSNYNPYPNLTLSSVLIYNGTLKTNISFPTSNISNQGDGTVVIWVNNSCLPPAGIPPPTGTCLNVNTSLFMCSGINCNPNDYVPTSGVVSSAAVYNFTGNITSKNKSSNINVTFNVVFNGPPTTLYRFLVSTISKEENVQIVNSSILNITTLASNNPPLWRNQSSNITSVPMGDPAGLAAQGFDDTGLNYSTLETNETGYWQNKTGSYNSSMPLSQSANTWVWSNFTWQNSTIRGNSVIGWRIHYNDTAGKTNATNMLAFTIQTSTAIALPTNKIDFMMLEEGASNDTVGNNASDPAPFRVRNDGNVPINISIQATSLFDSAPNPSPYFQARCTNSSEWSCGNGTGSIFTFTNIPASGSPGIFIHNLDYIDNVDEAKLDINVSAPLGETAGAKGSTVTFTSSVA